MYCRHKVYKQHPPPGLQSVLHLCVCHPTERSVRVLEAVAGNAEHTVGDVVHREQSRQLLRLTISHMQSVQCSRNIILVSTDIPIFHK